MQNKDLINWKNVSNLLANNDTSIRKNNIPKKYEERIEYLEFILDKFVKEEEVFTKDEVQNYLNNLVFPK
jgi:hypothetical protein